MNNIAITYMHMELKNAHTYLTQTMEDVTDEVAHFTPEGKANPIAGTYAHLVFSEDFFTQGIWKGEKPPGKIKLVLVNCSRQNGWRPILNGLKQ
jgi:hypothetical protein